MTNDILIRTSTPEDAPFYKEFLSEPDILKWFPMINEVEIQDAVNVALSYAKIGACLTAELNGKPIGVANLYVQPYKKLAHQCLFSIIIAAEHRGKGYGYTMMTELMKLAKEKFRIEMLHLEVYEGNPAIRLYQRLGFTEFGRQSHFIKEKGSYTAKILMQKFL